MNKEGIDLSRVFCISTNIARWQKIERSIFLAGGFVGGGFKDIKL